MMNRRRRRCRSLWLGVLVCVASAATAQDPASSDRAWPTPPPKQKNSMTRIVFPERPALELDATAGGVRRLVAQLRSDDRAASGTAFAALFWIGAPARSALAPMAERVRTTPKQATRYDARAYKLLRSQDRWEFCRPVATPHRLIAPVLTAMPTWMSGTIWPHGQVGRPKSVTVAVNTARYVSYGENYRGMQLLIVNRSGATIEVGRAGMRIDCIAEAETKDGWVAIETPPAMSRRSPKVWKLKTHFGAESAVPLYTGTLATRLRYRLTVRGVNAPVYSNVFAAKINPAQLTGAPGRLEHDHTPR